MRTLAIGDIHGRVEALREVLKLSSFDYENDKLIVLGDVVDGGYNTAEVVEELLKIKNIVYIIGNHDEWFMNHISSGWAENIWLQQGGSNTLRSYGASVKESKTSYGESFVHTANLNIPVTHQDFFNRGVYYHYEYGMMFVHGGFHPEKKIEDNDKHTLLWDRDLIRFAQYNPVPHYKKVFVGHTTTQSCGDHMHPLIYNNLYMLDCGAGWTGKLCIMDINTEEFWLSKVQKPALKYD